MACLGCQKKKPTTVRDVVRAVRDIVTPRQMPCLCATHGRQHCVLHQRIPVESPSPKDANS